MISCTVREVKHFSGAQLEGYLHSAVINFKLGNKQLDNTLFIRLIEVGIAPKYAFRMCAGLLAQFEPHILKGSDLQDIIRLGTKYAKTAATVKLHTLFSSSKQTI